MARRYPDSTNYSNRRKFDSNAADEAAEMRQAAQEDSNAIDNEMAKREAVVRRGLETKYGFTAEQVNKIVNVFKSIHVHTWEDAEAKFQFTSKEKRNAVFNAFNYYYGKGL